MSFNIFSSYVYQIPVGYEKKWLHSLQTCLMSQRLTRRDHSKHWLWHLGETCQWEALERDREGGEEHRAFIFSAGNIPQPKFRTPAIQPFPLTLNLLCIAYIVPPLVLSWIRMARTPIATKLFTIIWFHHIITPFSHSWRKTCDISQYVFGFCLCSWQTLKQKKSVVCMRMRFLVAWDSR